MHKATLHLVPASNAEPEALESSTEREHLEGGFPRLGEEVQRQEELVGGCFVLLTLEDTFRSALSRDCACQKGRSAQSNCSSCPSGISVKIPTTTRGEAFKSFVTHDTVLSGGAGDVADMGRSSARLGPSGASSRRHNS